MMLFGRFGPLCATAHKSSKSNRRLLTMHDENKDNADIDMHPSFQQFISQPTISGRFLKSKQQIDSGGWMLDRTQIKQYKSENMHLWFRFQIDYYALICI
jgi:hypothetical protein